MRYLLKFTLTLLVLMPALPAGAAVSLESIEDKTPGEQYRQLSLLMLVTGGTDPAMLELLQPVSDADDAGGSPAAGVSFDELVTPLVRFVEREILLAGAVEMFRFAYDNGAAIQDRLTEIARRNPSLISMADVNALAADAIIIREAIADSVEYTASADQARAAERLAAFRNQTVYLRNMMEYNEFQEELTRITNQAIIDLGGRLDAYQRMFDEQIDEDLIQRRIDSAQIMNAQAEERFEGEAMLRNAELMMMLILMESQVH